MFFDMLIEVINRFIEGVGTGINLLLSLLPDSPFKSISYNIDNSFIQYLTWLVPISGMLEHLTLFISIMIVWYGYRVLGNWLKVLKG